MSVRVQCITDPACVWSWACEPAVRALETEFGNGVEITFVMGGLAREFDAAKRAGMSRGWLTAAADSGMPTDPRIWHGTPPTSSYPACLAVKAAQEQGAEPAARLLRRVREGLTCFRRKLDHLEAFAELARCAGLDEERFRIDAASNAMVEAFGTDLDISREVPEEVQEAGEVKCSQVAGEERVPFPTFRFEGEGVRWAFGFVSPGQLRDAALAVGAQPAGERPDAREALGRYGTMAAPEVAAVCDLSPPRAELALAELVADGRARTMPVLAGRLYEPA